MLKLLVRGTNGTSSYTGSGVDSQGGETPRGGDGDATPLVKRSGAGMKLYAMSVAAGAATLLVLSLLRGYTIGNGWVVAALAAAGLIADRHRVTLGSRTEASISLIPILFAAVLFGPLAAMIVAAVALLAIFRTPYMRWAVYTCTRSIAGAMAGFAAIGAGELSSNSHASIAASTAAGAIAAELTDVSFTALTAKIRGNDVNELIQILVPIAFASVLFYAPLVGLLAAAYEDISSLTLPLFLAPALAAQRLFGLYQEQRRLTEELSTANVRLERANISFATALVATLDARDQYTAGHSAAVAIYARDIAAHLGLSDEHQQLAHLCGLVHDIGKIGLRSGLLEKPGALTLSERREMEKHSEIGERILAKVEDYAEVARVVRHHHERWDGQGYPDGLSGEDIPYLSRIIAVADAYNAMTSNRPYRDAMPSRVARMRLAQGAESQFDIRVVAAFEAILASASEAYRLAVRDDFTLEEQDRYGDRAQREVA